MEWFIDADAHVTESADVWTDRLPSKWAEIAPRMVRDPETREDFWYVGGQRTSASVGATAVGGSDDWVFPDRPLNIDECPLASWNAKARLEFLDSVGIWAQVIYPNVGGFGNQAFMNIKDEDFRLACVQAYNDWMVQWCAEDPRRLLGVAALPFWDVDACVKEVERCAALGFRSILFTGEPQRFTGKFFGESHWDPLWRIASETGLPMSLHLGSGNVEVHYNTPRFDALGIRTATAFAGVAMFLENAIQVSDLLLSGVFARFPDLKVVSVESGVGWLPFVLESADRTLLNYFTTLEAANFDMLPSEYFRRNMWACYFYEKLTDTAIEAIGADKLLFETDYPHGQCLNLTTIRQQTDSLRELPNEVRQKLLFENAASLYHIESPPLDKAAQG
ncbi:MAG TPA: amidohydrolase family protein [Acidimicrobiales bacterium]|nr:amidohydrolase family protein [Acidimicrobiales bacterium]